MSALSHPPLPELIQLYAKLEAFFTAVQARHAEAMKCGLGCAACCGQHLSVFALEAARVAEGARALPPSTFARARAQAEALEAGAASGPCPFLVDGGCSIYDARPLLCRAQGLGMLAAAESGETEYLVCELNFRDGPPPGGDLLALDRINTTLATLATIWAERHGVDPSLRLPLARVILEVADERR